MRVVIDKPLMLTTADIRAHKPCREGFLRWRRMLRDHGSTKGLLMNDIGAALMAEHLTPSDMRWAWMRLINDEIGEASNPFIMDYSFAEISRKRARKKNEQRPWIVIYTQVWAAALVAGLKVAYQDE